ncbi:hypothetical protein LHYA1_G000780 [Lachnellula hyalina]|uniref:Gamma-glutamylcyclotransferase AIG2-like domain-containing protein n=1 Tax=Lachnellula hyalina TaxID=1316788 RepID=A0A8H8RB33_9HELO|nr:uncharacterized protein LHYA1_G000780 [Lachnellula hyalina]TVY30879.1 hypothetical protein LHYA1_G000780 [Lachnellula hyalina]
MDLFDEVKNLAVSAAYDEPDEDDPSQGTIKMFQERFGYTYDQAAELVGITRNVKIAAATTHQAILSPAKARTIYALKLDGPISTPQKVQTAANLSTVPESYHGSNEGGDAAFCKVDGRSKIAIENWLSTQKETTFKPLFVPEGRAYKELCPDSLYPTLGKDTTLPQYRPQSLHLLEQAPSFGRTCKQFPVWYFFYGTLTDIPKLHSLLSLSEDEVPILHEAGVVGAMMKSWGMGKYNALVNGPESSCVGGSACLVMSEEHEYALRKYETSAYEVVRCLIQMNGIVVKGCTFRFAGETD